MFLTPIIKGVIYFITVDIHTVCQSFLIDFANIELKFCSFPTSLPITTKFNIVVKFKKNKIKHQNKLDGFCSYLLCLKHPKIIYEGSKIEEIYALNAKLFKLAGLLGVLKM